MKPRLTDTFRVVASALFAACARALRRLLKGPTRPTWGIGMDLMVAAQRGTWTVMPKIGMVRWRRVGDALSPPLSDGLPMTPVAISGSEGTIPAAYFEPTDARPGALLYLHGGGYVFGSLRTHGDLIGAVARATGLRTLAPEYRLAPEHPAPGALEDALAAYRFLIAQGIPPERIAIAGDSAGGGLVLALLLALKAAGEALPAVGIPLSPWVDLGCSGASFQENDGFDFVGETHCRLAAGHYLAGEDPHRPDLSPLFADLRGLPPLLIHAGEAEVLVDQIRAFAAKAEGAGVDVTLAVYTDMVHVWHMLRMVTPEAQRGIDEIGAFVRMHVP